MNPKFHITGLILLTLLCPMPGWSQPIPPEAKKFTLEFLQKLTTATASLAADLNQSTQPEQAAQAINTYSRKIEPLIVKFAETRKKYPDFFARMEALDEDAKTGDKEIDQAQEKFDAVNDTLDQAVMKIIPYLSHPEMQQALEKLDQTMSKMNPDQDDDKEEEDDNGND